MQCCQHWMQSWATSLHIPLQLVLWWQNLSSRLYCLLWPLHYLQNKETHHLFSGMTFVVELPPLDVPSFWALVCLSWLWPCSSSLSLHLFSILFLLYTLSYDYFSTSIFFGPSLWWAVLVFYFFVPHYHNLGGLTQYHLLAHKCAYLHELGCVLCSRLKSWCWLCSPGKNPL